MKLCSCGRPATHFVVMLTADCEPAGKKLICDAFPKCRTVPPAHQGADAPKEKCGCRACRAERGELDNYSVLPSQDRA